MSRNVNNPSRQGKLDNDLSTQLINHPSAAACTSSGCKQWQLQWSSIKPHTQSCSDIAPISAPLSGSQQSILSRMDMIRVEHQSRVDFRRLLERCSDTYPTALCFYFCLDTGKQMQSEQRVSTCDIFFWEPGSPGIPISLGEGLLSNGSRMHLSTGITIGLPDSCFRMSEPPPVNAGRLRIWLTSMVVRRPGLEICRKSEFRCHTWTGLRKTIAPATSTLNMKQHEARMRRIWRTDNSPHHSPHELNIYYCYHWNLLLKGFPNRALVYPLRRGLHVV